MSPVDLCSRAQSLAEVLLVSSSLHFVGYRSIVVVFVVVVRCCCNNIESSNRESPSQFPEEVIEKLVVVVKEFYRPYR